MLLLNARYRWGLMALSLAIFAIFAGCAGRPALIPVSDPDLKKNSAEFAADAAKRTYPATAPKGGDAQAFAEVDHGFYNRIRATNLSKEDWKDMEVWINEKYVVFLSTWSGVPEKNLKKINFQMLYDRDGKTFTIDNKSVQVTKIEIFKDGKLYTVPMRLAE